MNGIEYGYGSKDTVGATGVFSCRPKYAPGYQYRSTIDFGRCPAERQSLSIIDEDDDEEEHEDDNGRRKYIYGKHVMSQMAFEYLGTDYDLLRRNCCTFAKDACMRLGIKEDEIPTWFMNLANAAAIGKDPFAFARSRSSSVERNNKRLVNTIDEQTEKSFDTFACDFGTSLCVGVPSTSWMIQGNAPSLLTQQETCNDKRTIQAQSDSDDE